MQLHVGHKFKVSTMYCVKWPIVYCCVDRLVNYLHIPIFMEPFQQLAQGLQGFYLNFFQGSLFYYLITFVIIDCGM